MLASLALMRSAFGQPSAERLVFVLQFPNGFVSRGRCFLVVRTIVSALGTIGNLVKIAALEVTPLREMIDGTADFMRGQCLTLECSPAKFVRIGLHCHFPGGRTPYG